MAEAKFSSEETINVTLTPEDTINASVNDINYIPGYKQAEMERRAYYEDFKQRVENGEFVGEQGPEGPPGPQGEPGKDGTMTFEELTEEQKASLKGDKGDKGDPGEQGEQGEKGEPGTNGTNGTNGVDGADGKDGVTPNIQIGTVTTLAPGESATVTREGTDAEPIFNFGIPQGDIGEGGATTFTTLASGHGTSSSNPIILTGLEPGVYGSSLSTQKQTFYFKGTAENTSYAYTAVAFRVFTIYKKYEEAEEEETIGCLVDASLGVCYLQKQTSYSAGVGITMHSPLTNFIDKYKNTSVYGKLGFYEIPTCSETPTSDSQLTNKKYVDTAVSGVACAITTDGVASKTGRKIGGKDEYALVSEFTFGSTVNNWEVIATVPANAEIIDVKPQVTADGCTYFFPFSYYNVSTNTDQGITTYYEGATGNLYAQFNYDYIGGKSGKVYIYYIEA